jgi:hypothetical protein
VTCAGCPMLRVHDWHYFYCRHLGDQSKPDEWNAGWYRLHKINAIDTTACGLEVIDDGGF